MISNAVEDIEVDVWDKIKNSEHSGIEEIDSSYIELSKQKQIFITKRIVSIAAVFVFMFVGIYAIMNISELISNKGLNTSMYSSYFLAMVESNNRLFF